VLQFPCEEGEEEEDLFVVWQRQKQWILMTLLRLPALSKTLPPT
jgi:hypothetical protein